ncbi:ribosome recycling factor-domain-containing protein [Pavlovales sp. CCMP2436]|nr:ribosome recycling factor-domain-containing protein [Pavlovales sp. CCMP2436]
MTLALLLVQALAFIAPMCQRTAQCSAYAPQRPARAARVSMAEVATVKSVQKDVDDRMAKSIQALAISLTTLRTGRASPSMLDRILVDYFGTMTPLNQMASVSTPTAQQLLVDPYDKSALKDIERALTESDLGMNPSNDGQIIRLNVPQLTEDRRKEFAKQAKAFGEEGKVALRNIRRDAMEAIKKMEKAKETPLSKDESADAQAKVDVSVKKFTKQVDEAVSGKEKEIMKV